MIFVPVALAYGVRYDDRQPHSVVMVVGNVCHTLEGIYFDSLNSYRVGWLKGSYGGFSKGGEVGCFL